MWKKSLRGENVGVECLKEKKGSRKDNERVGVGGEERRGDKDEKKRDRNVGKGAKHEREGHGEQVEKRPTPYLVLQWQVQQ